MEDESLITNCPEKIRPLVEIVIKELNDVIQGPEDEDDHENPYFYLGQAWNIDGELIPGYFGVYHDLKDHGYGRRFWTVFNISIAKRASSTFSSVRSPSNG